MALTERSRNKIYETFSTLMDDEQAVEEMLSYFPARDVEEPATKEFVRAEIAALRTDIARLQARMTVSTIAIVTTVVGLSRIGG